STASALSELISDRSPSAASSRNSPEDRCRTRISSRSAERLLLARSLGLEVQGAVSVRRASKSEASNVTTMVISLGVPSRSRTIDTQLGRKPRKTRRCRIRRMMRVHPFPGDFHTQEIETNGVTIHVRVGGKGPAVILLHGYG